MCEIAILRQHTGASIDEKQNDIGAFKRDLGLTAHPGGQTVFLAVIVDAGGIDDDEFEIGKRPRRFAAVARDAGHVVDERKTAPGKTIKERGFSDIRSANDGEAFRHIYSLNATR
jgi:hypothetical protein